MATHTDEQEIRQLVSTWLTASKAGDVETVLSLMSDDVVFLVAGQPVMRKADFAGAARAQSGQGATHMPICSRRSISRAHDRRPAEPACCVDLSAFRST